MVVTTFVTFLGFALLFWGFVVEPRWLRIRRVPIRAKRPLARPLTVLHISDTHFPLYESVLRRFFLRLASLEPDLVVITGDMIENNDGILPCVKAVTQLKPRYGIYAVLGNHDHYEYGLKEALGFLWGGRFFPHKRNDVAALKRELAKVGCQVLVNEQVELALDGLRVSLIGLDDPVTRQADVDKAFKDANGADVNLLLTHTLDVLPLLNGCTVDSRLGPQPQDSPATAAGPESSRFGAAMQSQRKGAGTAGAPPSGRAGGGDATPKGAVKNTERSRPLTDSMAGEWPSTLPAGLPAGQAGRPAARSLDLALGGHTHGGQFSIPFFGALSFKSHCRMGRKYMAGLSRYGETVTYTSRGLGMGKFAPFRLFCRPESILYTIQ